MSNVSRFKIAAITDDGQTISQHFGRAALYLVATIENGQIVNRELRDKLGHAHFTEQSHSPEQPGRRRGGEAAAYKQSGEAGLRQHGLDAASHDKHLQMAAAIRDCQALLCRGMGRGAYESMQTIGIRPVVTDIAAIDEAVMAYVKGELVDRVDRLH
jgi:predicted Fe-Mo cluster-binding NifX family protein